MSFAIPYANTDMLFGQDIMKTNTSFSKRASAFTFSLEEAIDNLPNSVEKEEVEYQYKKYQEKIDSLEAEVQDLKKFIEDQEDEIERLNEEILELEA